MDAKMGVEMEAKIDAEMGSNWRTKVKNFEGKVLDNLEGEVLKEEKAMRPHRTFDCPKHSSPLIAIYRNKGIMRLAANNQSLVLTIAGRTLGPNSSIEQKAALGVFFGTDSPHNMSMRIPDGEANAHHGAELYAATMALETIQGSALESGVKLIIIKVGSPYILTAMSKKCWELVPTGFHDFTQNGYYRHAPVIGTLHKICTEFEAEGIEVKFWKIKTAANWEAVNLAQVALRASPRN
ncbi:hypothetical protein BKA61DRAFT_716008 [Leptodontidium sp. MPI-SDFR-AT-0119]|nr:hypothetical protein BKA61DRAFT_716008 [Leptodontidium sp. MPI-SDFR-AT-0119]